MQAAGSALFACSSASQPSPLPPPPPLAPRPLQWSSQPIYVLDKDNDLDVSGLAAVNAADIVRVQPQGPYLLGGHSYGGAVALEVAMVLESWGHTVGLVLVSGGRGGEGMQRQWGEGWGSSGQEPCPVAPTPWSELHLLRPLIPLLHAPPAPPCPPPQIMDTPRPDQIRRAQPEAEAASEEDSLELMEMILGALGGWRRRGRAARAGGRWRTRTAVQYADSFPPVAAALLGWSVFVTLCPTLPPQDAMRWAWALPSRTPARARSGGG
jgi:pimeloyl-ACP methyl ester carboxylesterase